jgi:MEMO1 family protein
MMNETLLHDSLSNPVPEVRRDLQIIPVQQNDRSLLYFHDTMGYTTPDFALDRKTEPVLSLLNGRQSIQQISHLLNGSIEPFDLLEFIQLLDQHRILDSKHFRLFSNRIEKDFEKTEVRKPALSGNSYPDDPAQLDAYLAQLFDEYAPAGDLPKPQKAIYAPHIDLRVGPKQYVEAFSALRPLRPKRVIILATSHYASSYGALYDNIPFIGSRKDLQIPGRLFRTDREFLDRLNDHQTGTCFTTADRAHRVEHSIELHLLFLHHIWKHDFSVVPILVGGIDDLFYAPKGHLAGQVETFTESLRSLDTPDTFYLISGDLSHVGKKFGDPEAAESMRSRVEQSDQEFIDLALEANPERLLQHLKKSYDATRICGYPPLYTFLSAFPDQRGKQINYHWWDESERKSAVSFGSISY